jgi:UDPglucose 6-dehydrogenase
LTRKAPSVAIVGLGDVGRSVQKLFPEATGYDGPLGIGSREAVNQCDYAFIAVPTPSRADGGCDTSVVEEVVGWLETEVIIVLSTIPPGTTEALAQESGKRIVFQPTYGPGETVEHPFNDFHNVRWLILGGEREATGRVVELYKTVYNAETAIWQTDARTAELAKYMENAYLAMKVTFCNEFYDIAEHFDVDYNELRELWLQDPRMGRSHTFVYPEDRGYGGKCLPKDVAAIIHAASAEGYAPRFLQAMAEVNEGLRKR